PLAGSSQQLRVGDLEIDRLGQQVRRAGKRIDLTSKEYALLEYLASHSGRVLSRTMIIEHVWDESFEGLTNIVDVYVRHLRSKVDDPFPTKLIRTVRGAGCSAELRPYQEIDLHAKVAGYLENISVDIGDRVNAGQLLAIIEVPEL